jgi:hypothetical protein
MQLADMDDSEWARNFPRYSDEAKRKLAEDVRAALKRVAAGNATHADAVRLAAALGHQDLFATPVEPSKATPIEDDAE